MKLVFDNKVISSDVYTILLTAREQSGRKYLKSIQNRNKDIVCTCPFHKCGNENHPSCFIKCDDTDENIVCGTYHCFTCGSKGLLDSFINKVFDKDGDFGKKWLIDNFSTAYLEELEYLPEIVLEKQEEKQYDESTINNLDFSNERALNYLTEKRKLSLDVIKYFRIGYDKTNDSIAFPFYSAGNKFLGFLERSIDSKRFHIPKTNSKQIYLLNEVIKNNYTKVYVCESQINALTLWGWGLPAIALLGTGCKDQYEILNKSGIRNFVLCFDGDAAGKSGCNKFIKNISKSALINVIEMPSGKDVNDLTKEEFFSLKQIFI